MEGGRGVLLCLSTMSQQCTLVAKLTNSILDYLGTRAVNRS